MSVDCEFPHCDCPHEGDCEMLDDTFDDELVGEDWIDEAYQLKTERNSNEEDYIHRL